MPSADVILQAPITRLNPFYPGQLGVAGASNSEGLRTSPTARAFYVDPNFPGVSDLRDGVDPECPLATIQAALALCRDFCGDTIFVGANDAWQYGPRNTTRTLAITEDVVVNVHGVRIVGLAPSSPLGVVWRPATSGGVACTINALDVLIEGFCFEGNAGVGGTAIKAVWDGTTAWGDSFMVRHCQFNDAVDIGIQLVYSWNSYICNCEFQACDNAGIYCNPADSPMAWCVIRDNIFSNVGQGGLGAMAISEAEHCTIRGNTIFNALAQAAAAATNEGINTGAGAGENLVADNFFSCLLPTAAPGDWDDFNSADANDAWVGNHCMDGLAVTTPT